MYFLTICLFLPVINALVSTRIYRNSIYRSVPPCAFISNISWPNDASIQSCIWECVHENNCQTAVYFKDGQVCSMFSELCEKGSIESSGNVSASIICYRKNNELFITCSSTTTTTTSSVSDSTSFWSFDNNTLDSLLNFNGEAVNNATYETPGINGYGSALSVDQNKEQFVNVSTYRNLSYRSFTVEMWFYCINLTDADHGLFGQCDNASTDRSLHYIIRSYKLYLGFYGDDLNGSTIILNNIWYHVAFVYDNSSSTQIIYLNGKLDSKKTSLGPYQGLSGEIVIGKTEQHPGTPHYFNGYIDDVLLTMRAKNASEILDDATLVCSYSFDGGSYYDSGPLHLNGIAVNVSFVNGRVNEAISFISNSSYYQIDGFVLLGISNYSYSIALWVYPFSNTGSTLVHISTTTTGQGWCGNLMGFSSNGSIIVAGWDNSLHEVMGPILPTDNWTHIVYTYSTTNGVQLYINGTLNGTTGSMLYSASGLVDILTLGNPLQPSNGSSCITQLIVSNAFNGSIDEFRVYSRELNITDIYALANP